MNERTLYEHIAGTLFGLAAGDALGAVTEGMTPRSIREKYGRIEGFLNEGQAGTDDTEFTVFYISLLEKYGRQISTETVAKHYFEDIYHPSETYKGAGFSEAMTLQNLKRGLMPPASGQHLHSWSDGLAMCAAAFGCAYSAQPQKAADLAGVFGSVSHHGEGIFGGQAVAAAVAEAFRGSEANHVVEMALSVIPEDSWTAYNIRQAVKICKTATDVNSIVEALYDAVVFEDYYWSDLAPEAVALAFGLFLAAKGDFTQAVLGAVNLGRDADTVAAIAGALCGALHGLEHIPEKFRRNVHTIPGRCIRKTAGFHLADAAGKLLKIALSDEVSDES
jgi:ADP-ribosylglycohydrolase